ncbi:MAG TPA: DUF4143 domain-containing protein [Puia sp.]|nr:DUF4143 domain-containing protein [Puia sp.]
MLKQRFNRGQRGNFYFWRDRTGNEVDILLDTATGAIPVEVKAGATYRKSFLKGIHYWEKMQSTPGPSFLIYTGETSYQQQRTSILNWKALERVMNL